MVVVAMPHIKRLMHPTLARSKGLVPLVLQGIN